jgi:hypothetical protein
LTRVPQPLISELERDKRPQVALMVIERLATALQVTLDWLVHGDHPEEGALSIVGLLKQGRPWRGMEP